MTVKYSPSVNIIRDSKKELNYIITSNAERAALTISDQFRKGIHSYTIIGSYGTGKSSFLWAMEQTLTNRKQLLSFKINTGQVKFLNFVGVYQSLIEHLAEEFQIKNDLKGNQRILDAIFQEYEKINKKNGLLVIVIDEFGKFLEYASKFNPERELYFIQQLAEFVNDHNRNILLITTLHQNFEAYSGGSLSELQKQEWRKIKGRLKEITFNEPAEQLLILAAKRLSQNGKRNFQSDNSVVQLEKKHHIFSVHQNLVKEIGNTLFPLDFFSAFILTQALQRYGQNERSLFTFLETETLKNERCGISEVYDYLYNEFYSYITTKNNLDYTHWAIIRDAIERYEATLEKDGETGIKIIKTVGLLSLFANKGAKVDDRFIKGYFALAEYSGDTMSAIKDLRRFKIIRFNSYNQSFKLFEGTDVNIEEELLHAAHDVADEVDIVRKLKDYFDFPLLLAKAESYKKGTPRFFSFEITDDLITKPAVGELDGSVILVLNEKLDEKSLQAFSKKNDEANLYGFFKKSKQIKDIILDIEKTRLVREKNDDDRVARRELDNILNSQRQLLNHFVWDAFYSGDVEWIFAGKVKKIKHRGDLNRTLSEICSSIYPETPVYKNELINRQAISGPIHGARKNYFSALVNKSNEEDLGFPKETFPPEKTIYVTLLKETQIHLKSEGKYWDFAELRKDSAFYNLWQASEQFLESCQSEKRPLSAFFDTLSAKPFKLKQGFLEFWIPTYLFIKRDDFALYGDHGYVPEINESILYLFTRNAKEFNIKTFDVRGVKLNLYNRYRQFLQLTKEAKASNKSFIESIRPFLVLYKQLPEYTKRTNRLNPETLAIRRAIENSQDPEKVFFEDFPKALKTNVKQLSSSKEALENYIANLQGVIRELRTSLDELIDRIELFLVKEALGDKKLKFPDYKVILQKRYQGLKEHQLLQKQRTFLMRINSPLDDRKSWITSVTHAVVGKGIEHLSDEDEEILKDRLLFSIQEMDNLSEISNEQKEEGEEVVKLDITSHDGLSKNIIRLPKGKQAETKKQFLETKKSLGSDKRINVIILTQLLKDQLK
jgi:hypothetical protein